MEAVVGGDSMITHDLNTLHVEVISLLERIANQLTSPKDQIVFLINNADQV